MTEKQKAEDEGEVALSSSTSPQCRIMQSRQGLCKEATQTDTEGAGGHLVCHGFLQECLENSHRVYAI